MNSYQKEEYRIWQDVVNELSKAGVDINRNDNLNEALIEWARVYGEMNEFHKREQIKMNK